MKERERWKREREREREQEAEKRRKGTGRMKSFELAVNIERVIRSLKNTWTIIKPPWGQGLQPGGKGATQKLLAKRGRGERRMQKETEGRMQRRRGREEEEEEERGWSEERVKRRVPGTVEKIFFPFIFRDHGSERHVV